MDTSRDKSCCCQGRCILLWICSPTIRGIGATAWKFGLYWIAEQVVYSTRSSQLGPHLSLQSRHNENSMLLYHFDFCNAISVFLARQNLLSILKVWHFWELGSWSQDGFVICRQHQLITVDSEEKNLVISLQDCTFYITCQMQFKIVKICTLACRSQSN